jgi:hypothetical protein
MSNPIEVIKELPLDARRDAVWEILQTFPEDDPIFENEIFAESEILSEEEILLIDERIREVESGRAVFYTRDEINAMIIEKFGVDAVQTKIS